MRTTLYTYTSTATRAMFAFANGTDIAIDLTALTPEIQHALMVHGLKQKVADGAAIPRDTVTGRSASDGEKITAMKDIANRIIEGEWSARASGGGNAGGLLLRALLEMYPERDAEGIKAFLAGKSDKEKAALRANPRVAAIIERLRPAPTGIDVDSMLDELAD